MLRYFRCLTCAFAGRHAIHRLTRRLQGRQVDIVLKQIDKTLLESRANHINNNIERSLSILYFDQKGHMEHVFHGSSERRGIDDEFKVINRTGFRHSVPLD